MNTKHYTYNRNRFSPAMFCKEHNMNFHVRCSNCFSELGKDPDYTFIDGRPFCLVYDVNHL